MSEEDRPTWTAIRVMIAAVALTATAVFGAVKLGSPTGRGMGEFEKALLDSQKASSGAMVEAVEKLTDELRQARGDRIEDKREERIRWAEIMTRLP